MMQAGSDDPRFLAAGLRMRLRWAPAPSYPTGALPFTSSRPGLTRLSGIACTGISQGFTFRGDAYCSRRLANNAGADSLRAVPPAFMRTRHRSLNNGDDSFLLHRFSIDIGITPDLMPVDGSRSHGAGLVKAIGSLFRSSEACSPRRNPGRPRRLLVIGGGAAGTCLAFSLRSDCGWNCGRVIDSLGVATARRSRRNHCRLALLPAPLLAVSGYRHEAQPHRAHRRQWARGREGAYLHAMPCSFASHAQAAPAVSPRFISPRTPDGVSGSGKIFVCGARTPSSRW